MQNRSLLVVLVLGLVVLLGSTIGLIIYSLGLQRNYDSQIASLNNQISDLRDADTNTSEGQDITINEENPTDTSNTEDDQPSTPSKVRKDFEVITSTVQGWGGNNQQFSIEIDPAAKIEKADRLNGGGVGFVGYRVTDDNGLDMRFGLPYEAFSTNYISREMVQNPTIANLYIVTTETEMIFETNGNSVFYTNKFYAGGEEMSCSPSTEADICANPVLIQDIDNPMYFSFLFVQCANTTEQGIARCDEVMNSFRFEGENISQ